MWELDSGTLITIITILTSGIGIVLGCIVPAIMEGQAVKKALDGVARREPADGASHPGLSLLPGPP